MKTETISIPDYLTTTVLSSLHDGNITCEYKGLDNKKNLLMQLTFLDARDEHVKRVIKFIGDKEKEVEEVMGQFNSVIPKMTGDQIIAWGTLKRDLCKFFKIIKNE